MDTDTVVLHATHLILEQDAMQDHTWYEGLFGSVYTIKGDLT